MHGLLLSFYLFIDMHSPKISTFYHTDQIYVFVATLFQNVSIWCSSENHDKAVRSFHLASDEFFLFEDLSQLYLWYLFLIHWYSLEIAAVMYWLAIASISKGFIDS